MGKIDRQKIFDKYNGKCAYCGCELQKGWHIDEIIPVRRSYEYIRDDEGNRIYDTSKHDFKKRQIVLNPENFNFENQNPACPSCNVNKHSMSLEEFRELIANFPRTLKQTVQYKFALKYGLVQETDIKVEFYFEKIDNTTT